MASKLSNVQTTLIDTSDVSTKHHKIKGILTKFFDPKIVKESNQK